MGTHLYLYVPTIVRTVLSFYGKAVFSAFVCSSFYVRSMSQNTSNAPISQLELN